MLSAKTVSGAVAAAGFVAALTASAALAAGPFGPFAGAWRGHGRISDIHGKSEALSCRSNNAPSDDGIAMELSLVCASDSYRVDFHSDLYTDGRTLRGQWRETTRDAEGELHGEINANVIHVVTTAPGFSANVVIHVSSGDKLDVDLRAHGTSIDHVTVTMKR